MSRLLTCHHEARANQPYYGCTCLRVVLVVLLLLTSSATAEPLDLRVRVAWGGGVARRWNVSASLSEGKISHVDPLGFEPDEPASMHLYGREVRVNQRTKRAYDGFDMNIQCDAKSMLMIAFTPADGSPAPEPVRISMNEFRNKFHSVAIDDQQNRLLVRRAPGDEIRLQFERDSLVFQTGESFRVQAQPYATGAEPNTQMQLTATLIREANTETVWTDAVRRTTNAEGELGGIDPFDVPLPKEEGVYRIDFDLKAIDTSIVAKTIFGETPIAKRSLQIVVLAPSAKRSYSGTWKAEFEYDPAASSVWDRVKQLPIPVIGSETPTGNNKAGAKNHLKRTMLSLAPGGWQAIPLKVQTPGRPHILEVEYPADIPQTLSLSILEPDEAGRLTPLGVDSGVHTPNTTGRAAKIAVHSIPFWPRTQTPKLLVMNRDENRPALFSKIRIISGSAALPPARPITAKNSRKLLAWYDKPLFAENFSAGRSVDQETGRTLDDWKKFYNGGERLVQYLKFAGYDGAVISVACEGSAIYPSALLEPTPKFDTGVFFSNGQDARRKDILEMLMRLFDREGLTLIPAIQFTSPLPELEYLKLSAPRTAAGIDLVNPDGQPWPPSNSTNSSPTIHYNPLDDRVAGALSRVVGELSTRYEKHAAFGGICLRLGAASHAQLPDAYGGYDPRTIARFENELGLRTGDTPTTSMNQRAANLLGKYRTAWLHWRALQINNMLVDMRKKVAAGMPEATLFITPTGAFASESVAATLRPRLTPQGAADQALLEVGLSLDLLKEAPGITLAHPHEDSIGRSVVQNAMSDRLRFDPTIAADFARGGSSAALIFQQPLRTTSPGFDATQPFGDANAKSFIASHFAHSEQFARRSIVHAIAASDSQTIMYGGWMLPLGVKKRTSEVTNAFRHLPNVAFRNHATTDLASQTTAFAVRSAEHKRARWLYVVNDSPLAVNATIQLRGGDNGSIESVDGRSLPPLIRGRAGFQWKVALKPYDIVVGRIDQTDIAVSDWKIELPQATAIRTEVVDSIRAMRERAKVLARPPQLPQPANASFEATSPGEPVANWVVCKTPGVEATVVAEDALAGKQSLKLSSTRPVAWVRSDTISPPVTGRITVWVWLKVADASKQPKLRLAIEGRHNGRVYYKFAPVGQGADARDIHKEWQPFIFHVDDLPTENLTDLRVGFDLMEQGEVFIDELRVYDRWFNPETELVEINKQAAIAEQLVNDQNRIVEAHRLMQSYWPRYLTSFVRLPGEGVATLPVQSRPPTPGRMLPPLRAPAKILQRVRALTPKRLWPF